MGTRFFKIVGLFSYVVAAVALFAAIALVAIGGAQFTKGVDESIQKPNPTLELFLRDQKAARQDQKPRPGSKAAPSDDAGRKEAVEAFQVKIAPLFNRIVSALDKFAAETKQDSVNPKGLEKYLIKETPELQGDKYLEFLSSLAKEAESLGGKASQIATLPEDDPAYIKWRDFVPWFVASYMEQYRGEQGRIQKERLVQAANRVEALTLLGAAASAFLVFVFFTMILLLIQIEAHTRHVNESVALLQDVTNKVELSTRATALALRPRANVPKPPAQ